MIYLLPYLEGSIKSEKSPEEIARILKSITDSQKSLLRRDTKAEFTGEVTPAGFKVVSNINYRNSFLPVIEGRVRTEEDASLIEIKMRLHPLVRVFLLFWFGMVSFFVLLGIADIIMSGFHVALRLFLPAGGLFTLAYLMVRGGFYLPARKAMERLENLL